VSSSRQPTEWRHSQSDHTTLQRDFAHAEVVIVDIMTIYNVL